MLIQSADKKYTVSLRILHWLIALMILGLLAVGLYMTGLSRSDPLRATLFSLHKSFGITVLALAALRLILRLIEGAPPLPEVIPAIERKLAHLGHWTLYAFMFLLPISGYTMSTSYGSSVNWFGVTLPKLLSIDRARGAIANAIHVYGAYVLIGLLVLHIGAVLLHYIQHRVNLLRRML